MSLLARQYKLFDGKVAVFMTGTEFGHMQMDNPDFAANFERFLQLCNQTSAIAINVDFNTRVKPIYSINQLQEIVPGCFMPKDASDGVVVSLDGSGLLRMPVLQTNADCSIVKILAPNNELAVLHCGLKNILNENNESIIQNAAEHFRAKGIQPHELQFAVGDGAGPCCYGRSDGPAGSLPVKNPPRKGLPSIDVPILATMQAEQAGITKIFVDNFCTSCSGLSSFDMDTHGHFWSNLRESKEIIEKRGFASRNGHLVCTLD